MSHEKSPNTVWDDLFSFERRLRKASKRAWKRTAAESSELTQLLQRIAQRRKAREVPGGKRNRYTIASAPSDPYLEFCIEAVPSGRVAPHLIALTAGALLDIKHKVSGEFLLVPHATTHVMLATGTGISPFRSMLRAAVALGAPRSTFVILHGASFADELVYRDELAALAQQFSPRVRYVQSVSRPNEPRNDGFQGLAGRVADLAPALVKELQASDAGRLQVYACGHPDMVAAAHARLEPLGLPVQSEVFD